MQALISAVLAGTLMLATSALSQNSAGEAPAVTLPDGLELSVFATGLDDPRVLARTEAGDLLVTLRKPGKVVLIKRDGDGDGRSDGSQTLKEGLENPHGLWLEGNKVYVATEGYIYSYDFDGTSLANDRLLTAGLPAGGGHRTRTIKRGPDGFFYVTIGSSCNVCLEYHPLRATMIQVDDTGNARLVARGLRNTVGFDWQPGTNALFGVDNGRDWMGNDEPPEELNLIVAGAHYGWPFVHGTNIRDPDFGGQVPTDAPLPPVFGFTAHSAPLSITFLEHQPQAADNGTALVALHGSWNRAKPSGYEIVRLRFGEGTQITQEPFMGGCLAGGQPICRPTDILEAPDGVIFVSDDAMGKIYRIARKR